MPLVLGYVDVVTQLSSSSPRLRTFPLSVIVAAAPLNEPRPAVSALLATNAINVDDLGAVDLRIGAIVTRNDATGQALEFLVVPESTLVDAEVRIRVNTSVLIFNVDYSAAPSPARGESFVVVGARSNGTGPVPAFAALLGVTHGTEPSRPRDSTHIALSSTFDQPRRLLVGQQRQRTAVATYSSGTGQYRRAFGDAGGMLLDVTLHDPSSPSPSWVHVDIAQPRAGDGPARPVAPADGGVPGGVTVSDVRRYQVTWVQQNGNETAPTPVSELVTTISGSIRVPLPIWTDPLTPGLTGPVAPDPVERRRVYRTVGRPGSETSDGEALLVHEEPNNTASFWIDTQPDTALTEPLLTDLRVRYRHTLDRDAAMLAAGLATLQGELVQTSYEEDLGGTPQTRGTRYVIDLSGTPPAADIVYTTRPPAGVPRVTWRSHDAAGPRGVSGGVVRVIPIGYGSEQSQAIAVRVAGVPPDFGVDWFLHGATRTKIEVGLASDTTAPLPDGLDLLTLHAALVPGDPPPASLRTGNIDLTPDALTLSARGVRRLRLLLGLPRPLNPRNAELDDGIVAEVELDPRRDGPRSFRLRRDALEATGTGRLMVRAGELPDQLIIDARPGHAFRSSALAISGRLQRVLVLSQTPEELATQDVSEGRRRNGTWVAITDTGSSLAATRDGDHVTISPASALRADVSQRSSIATGSSQLIIRQLQASASIASETSLELAAATRLKVETGASGRLALSGRALDPAQPDSLLAVRATPQVKLTLHHDALLDEMLLDDMTARWLGLQELILPDPATPDPFELKLTPERANLAFRGHALSMDERLQAEPWDLVRARVADLPETAKLSMNSALSRFRLELNRRSGRVVVFAQPPEVPESGVAANTFVGLGLAKADIDSLPNDVQVDVLGPTNDMQSVPFNASPPSDYRQSGFRVKTDGELIARAVQLISVAHVRPWPRTAFWSNLAASLIHIKSDGGAPGAVWLWTPAEALPSALALPTAWEDLTSWLGYRIESPALVTLQLQVYEDDTGTIPRRWHDPSSSWELNAEFQMKDYRGEVTVDADISPEGDDDAGPGQWYLRVPDGAPLGGQIVFGNTGGWISNRPRIFAPFSLDGDGSI